MRKIWSITQPSGNEAKILCESLNLSPVVADILVQRGINTTEAAVDFLRPSVIKLASPFCFKDMSRAVERLAIALKQQEKVLIYGDYDVDGITSTALLYKVLIDLGFKAVAYIPHRQEEGYGLNAEAILKAAQAEVKLLITVDCGISAVNEIEIANSNRIDVIITDHHEPPAVIPKAFAILNPKLDHGYPFRDLAGVGVAFKLAQALLQEFAVANRDVLLESELWDLVALGTIADIVPLVGENRILVHYGLRQMENTAHPGLAALLEECGLKDKTLKTGQIAFLVAPRINAIGRMDSARAGLELLLTGNPTRARELAQDLTKENLLRQDTEKRILAEAIDCLEKAEIPKVIVLSGPNWHHGVIGIVASRLVERYYRPVFVIGEDGDEAKGSARGIPGYHVLENLTAQSDLLDKFGGHRQAAGFSLKTKNIDNLRLGLNEIVYDLPADIFDERLAIDHQVTLDQLDDFLFDQLERLAPFGYGNSGPVLAGLNLPLKQLSTVGKEQNHLKLLLGADSEWEGIAFRQGDRLNDLQREKDINVAFNLDRNSFQGRDKLQLLIKDIQTNNSLKLKPIPYTNPLIQETGYTFVNREAAASLETENISSVTMGLTWIDWRNLPRKTWINLLVKELGLESIEELLQEQEQSVIIWNSGNEESTIFTLAGFLGNGISAENSSLDRIKPKSGNSRMIGIIAGLSDSWQELAEGIAKFREFGINQIALTEFSEPAAENKKHDLNYFSREALIKHYRELQKLALAANPFVFHIDNQQQVQPILIFEELGLLRCLGGTTKLLLEWLPVNRKLDLDSSLHFVHAKQEWQKREQFHRYLLKCPLDCLETDLKGRVYDEF